MYLDEENHFYPKIKYWLHITYHSHPAAIPILCQKWEFTEFIFEKIYRQKEPIPRAYLILLIIKELFPKQKLKAIETFLNKYRDINIIPENCWEQNVYQIWKMFENDIELFKDCMVTVRNPFYVKEIGKHLSNPNKD